MGGAPACRVAVVKALTLWRPWPWAILHMPRELAKGVENRTWPPPPSIIGETIALHAGQRFDAEALDFIAARCLADGPLPPQRAEEHPLGIVGVARVIGCRDAVQMVIPGCERLRAPRDPWFVGPVGWLLADTVALAEPVPCKGVQGLWVVPADVEARARASAASACATRGRSTCGSGRGSR